MDVRIYVDYGSPYSYLAWQRLQRYAERYAGHTVHVLPVSAGHIFRTEGGKPNASYPNLLKYNDVDVARWADAYGVPWVRPEHYPQRTVEAARCHYHLRAVDPARADAWTESCFLAHWRDGAHLDDPAVLRTLTTDAGFTLEAALEDKEARDRLVQETAAAYAAGAPGVPYVVLDGEGFWGNDRLEWVEARLAGKAVPALAPPTG